MDDRTMREIHVCADVAPAAVIYNGRGTTCAILLSCSVCSFSLSRMLRLTESVVVAARRQPERERAKLLAFDERPNGTWHKHSFSFSSLASPHTNGASLVVANNALWAFAVTEEGMVVTWRGASTDSAVIDWQQKSLTEALYDTHGSLSAFAVSDRHILCVAFSAFTILCLPISNCMSFSAPSRQVILHRYSTKRCGWSKEPKILQLGTPPTGLKGNT